MAQQRRKLKADAIKSVVVNIKYTDFTDGGAAAGTYDASDKKLPAGSRVLGCRLTLQAPFTGDTTAVAIAGTSTDDDAFYETAENVFAALTAAKYGAPATYNTDDFLTAETTIRITVTSGADFTAVNGGQLTVEVFYLDLNAKSK